MEESMGEAGAAVAIILVSSAGAVVSSVPEHAASVRDNMSPAVIAEKDFERFVKMFMMVLLGWCGLPRFDNRCGLSLTCHSEPLRGWIGGTWVRRKSIPSRNG